MTTQKRSLITSLLVPSIQPLEEFQWALENGYAWNTRTCKLCNKKDLLDIVELTRNRYFASHNVQLQNDWDFIACKHAAETGQLEILKWLYENKCYWNGPLYDYFADSTHHYKVSSWIKGL